MLYIVLEQGWLVIDLEQRAVQAFSHPHEMNAAYQAIFAAGGFTVLKQ